MKINTILIFLFFLSIVFVSGCNTNTIDNTIVASGNIGSSVGDIAPDFSITDTYGSSYSLSQFKGKPVVFAYFATWCIPCQIEANNVKQVDDETGGNAFEVFQIGVDSKESSDDLKNFKTQYGNEDWIVGFGFDVAEQYKVRNLDTTLIIDSEGKIIYRDNGVPASVETLRNLLT